MHPEAYEWLKATIPTLPKPKTVLDIGGRNVNGSIREFFAGSRYTALDIIEDFGVDIVADARTWKPTRKFDVVVSTETLEHIEGWEQAVHTMANACKGHLVMTAACHPRAPHSGIDGGPVRPGEHYGNVNPEVLGRLLNDYLADPLIEVHPRGDVYAVGQRRSNGT